MPCYYSFQLLRTDVQRMKPICLKMISLPAHMTNIIQNPFDRTETIYHVHQHTESESKPGKEKNLGADSNSRAKHALLYWPVPNELHRQHSTPKHIEACLHKQKDDKGISIDSDIIHINGILKTDVLREGEKQYCRKTSKVFDENERDGQKRKKKKNASLPPQHRQQQQQQQHKEQQERRHQQQTAASNQWISIDQDRKSILDMGAQISNELDMDSNIEMTNEKINQVNASDIFEEGEYNIDCSEVTINETGLEPFKETLRQTKLSEEDCNEVPLSSTPKRLTLQQGSSEDEYHQVVKFSKRVAPTVYEYRSTSILKLNPSRTGTTDKAKATSENENGNFRRYQLQGSAESKILPGIITEQDDAPIIKQRNDEDCTSDNDSSLNMQTVCTYVPKRVQVVLKKKRSNECFADAVFDANNAKSSKDRSVANSKTYIMNDPQHCAVSATLSLGRPKKLFIQKGKRSNAKSIATATFPVSVSNPIVDDGIIADSSKHMSPANQNIANEPSADQQSSIPFYSPQVKPIQEDAVPLQVPFTDDKVRSSDDFNVSSKLITNDHTVGNGIQRTESATSTLYSRSSNPSDYNTDISTTSHHSRSASKESLTNRLSKGFFDFTQGSSDRLQRWKNKLQYGRRHKDSSEPPPMSRMASNQEASGNLSDAGVVLDWTNARNDVSKMRGENDEFDGPFSAKFGTRIMHPTRSASDLSRVSKRNNRERCGVPDEIMEHRTLRQRDDNDVDGSRSVKNLTAQLQNYKSSNIKNQQNDNYDNTAHLPPPVRIAPFSGIKPKDSDIIRPVAFRPYVPRQTEKRQSFTSDIPFYSKTGSTAIVKRLSTNDEQKRPTHVKEAMSNHVVNITRPRGIYQPSTSSSLSPNKITKAENDENEYDVVPEFLDRNKACNNDPSNNDSNHLLSQLSFQHVPSTLNVCGNSSQQTTTNTFASYVSTNVHSPHSLVKKSSSTHQVCGSNASNGSRYSSGIHVTPSPSDSGIVDYETIIRDKENELYNVRTTMEQNEEIVIKVYMEKERMWKEQLADLKQKLQASQQGENALRQQIQRCNEQREQFQTTMQNLTSEKQGLQRKCLQIERELFQLRERFDEISKNRSTICESCRRYVSRGNHNGNYNIDKKTKPPIPAPRLSKDISSERELRSEVDELRSEVSTLRETLNEQINMFADERKRWEEERNKILGTGRVCQTNGSDIIIQGELKQKNDGKSCMVSRDRLI